MRPDTTAIELLTDDDRRSMFALLNRCFSGVTLDSFNADLANKTLAIRLHDAQSCLQGFSTLAFYPAEGPDGVPVTIACSGDTIVAPEAWGDPTLARVWINTVFSWHAIHGRGPLFWLLITSGFRTYRFLPVFFEQFYPHHERPTPAPIAAWMHTLAVDRWGAAYDRASGVVRFDQPQSLREALAHVPDAKARNPHVRHFLSLNPHHAQGDELVSLCRLSRDNLTRAGRRMVEVRTELARGGSREQTQ